MTSDPSLEAVFAGGPFEPLAESAPLAWREAPSRCLPACLPYHRVWQYLRWLGVITTIRTNSDFLIRTFSRLAGAYPRVLVSGTADYGMLAHLQHAYGGRPLDATIVDMCATPLWLNRWYAERVHLAVRTVQENIITFAPDAPFDLVTTHNFIGRFDEPARRRLVDAWWNLLRPGGVVVTTQRVRPQAREAVVAHSVEEVETQSAHAAALAQAAGMPAAALTEFRGAVREHLLRRKTVVVRAASDVRELFEWRGFEIDEIDDGGGADERRRDRPSSIAGPETFRMRIVARRPAS